MMTNEKSKYLIKIDSSVRNETKVQLTKDENVIDERTGKLDMVVAIDEILKNNNLSLEDISEFVPVNKPGSFTGLRMSFTVCNVLNWALDKKSRAQHQLPKYGAEPNIHTKTG